MNICLHQDVKGADMTASPAWQPTIRYEVVDATSDEYLKTDAYITILVPGDNGMKRVSEIRQTGICQPGPWPARAVYEYDDKYWVFEAGWLVPSDEWHKHQRELGEA